MAESNHHFIVEHQIGDWNLFSWKYQAIGAMISVGVLRLGHAPSLSMTGH